MTLIKLSLKSRKIIYYKNTSYFLVFFFLLLSASNCLANCSKDYSKILEQKVASSGIAANLFGGKDSLSSVVSKMLSAGNKRIINLEESGCGEDCEGLSSSPMLKLTVSPSKFLTSYKGKNVCKQLEQETSQNKLKYNTPKLKDENDFNKWFSDFVRGKGKAGRKLYKDCYGACSPNYEVFIDNNESNLKARIEVVCGEARDKSEGEYLLVSEAVWACSNY